jgi:cysteine synthase
MNNTASSPRQIDHQLSSSRREVYAQLHAQITPTPLYRISRIAVPHGNRIWAKEEFRNPTESAFDRVYPGLFQILEERGSIVPFVTPVIECSLGNAGASFAWTAKQLGYKATVITNADTPPARIQQIKSYGAKVIFSPALEYGTGYVKLLNHLLERDRIKKGGKAGENSERLFAVTKIMYEARACFHSLAKEALAQRESSDIAGGFDFFVSAVGSGDLICGVSEYLKSAIAHLQTIAIEPAELRAVSALREGRVLEYRPLSVDQLMIGVTATGVPRERLNIDFDYIDRIETVSIAEWELLERMLMEQECKFVGRTSAGVLAAALRLSETVENQDILIVFYDSRWKYGDRFPSSDAGQADQVISIDIQR